MSRLRARLTGRAGLVVVVGVLLALAWALPSLGAGAGKVARLALGRANQAFHNANLAINTSDNARSTANSANATANSANATANAANSTANSAKSAASTAQSAANAAQSAANTALSIANAAAHANVTKNVDAGNITAGSCESSAFSQAGVLATDVVIVTPPNTQPLGLIAQATTSSNLLTLVLCNITGSPIEPPLGTYKFSIFR